MVLKSNEQIFDYSSFFWSANCLDHDDQVSWTERRRILAALVKKMQKVLKTGQPCPDFDVESPKIIKDNKNKIY